MGMYDYINGEQVKVFYMPIYDDRDKDTWHSGGSMREYNNGDSVPLKTLYYNRPKNFIIFDENDYEGNPIIHIIKDGKVFGTFRLSEANPSLFDDNELVFNYYGGTIKIKSVQDCYDFIKETKERNKEVKEIRAEYNNLLNTVLAPLSHIISDLKSEGLRHKMRPTKEEKLEIVFKSLSNLTELQNIILTKFNCESLDNLKSLLIDDDEMWSLFKEQVIPMAEKEFDIINAKMETIDTKTKSLVEEIDNAYSDKWFPENQFTKESQLGEYLDSFGWLYSQRKEPGFKDIVKPSEDYLSIKSAIREFLLDNPGIEESYIKWLELDNNQALRVKFVCVFATSTPDEEEVDEVLLHLENIFN